MLRKIIDYIKGYKLMSVKGGAIDRFLNICTSKKVRLWDVHTKDNETYFFVEYKNNPVFDTIIEKTGVNIKLISEHGIPYIYKKNRKRKMFIIGFLLYFILIWEFTTFIWDINVYGYNNYSAEEVEKNIKEKYIGLGTKTSDVDCDMLESSLREEYKDIAWISCEVKGTQLNVNMTETITPGSIDKSSSPCNIVAAKDAVICDMIIKEGSGVHGVGDEVKKGDVLVSGAVNIFNEYDELLQTDYVCADAVIYGQSILPYEYSFTLEHYEKEYSGKTKKYHAIDINGTNIEPFKYNDEYENCDIVTDYNKLKLFETFYLPIVCKKTIVSEYTPVLSVYTEEEARKKAELILCEYVDGLKKKGVEILQNNVKISISKGKCVASGNLVVKELIGIPDDITVYKQGD